MNNIASQFEMLDLFEMTPDLVCIAGADGYFRRINPAVINKLGYTEEELFACPIASFIHPDDREYTRKERGQLLQGKMLLNFQNRYIAKDGAIIWLEWTSVYLPDKEIVFAIAKDISATKEREKATEEKYMAYKNMATHFKSRAEENRKYLANELHEEVAQLATAVKLQIAWINQQVKSLPEEVKEKSEEALLWTDKLVKMIRRISYTASPNMLDDLGFNATVEWECQEFALRNGISCQFTSLSNEELPEGLKIDLYRICQEVLIFIASNASATSVSLSLHDMANTIILTITCDGKNFDTAQLQHAPGLINMRQLIASINGQLTIRTEPGKATMLEILIPK